MDEASFLNELGEYNFSEIWTQWGYAYRAFLYRGINIEEMRRVFVSRNLPNCEDYSEEYSGISIPKPLDVVLEYSSRDTVCEIGTYTLWINRPRKGWVGVDISRKQLEIFKKRFKASR